MIAWYLALTDSQQLGVLLSIPTAIILLGCVAGFLHLSVVSPLRDFYRSHRLTPWEYGKCTGGVARRSLGSGEVQKIIWEAGEQGHAEDCWITIDSSHWHGFVPWAEGKS